jgi:hypothetical protein
VADPQTGVPVAPATSSRPRAVRVAVLLWWASALAGLVGVLAAAANYDAIQAALAADAISRDPSASADVVSLGVRATLWVVLGAWALLLVTTMVGTTLVLHRRAWARWLLLGTGLVALLVADVAQDLVAGGAELDRIGFIAQAVLAVLGLVALFARSSRSWLRGSPG